MFYIIYPLTSLFICRSGFLTQYKFSYDFLMILETLTLPDPWSVKTLLRIRQKVDEWVWSIIWSGNFDKEPRYLHIFSRLTQFVQISDWFGILVFSDDISHEDKMIRINRDIAVTHFLHQSRKSWKLHPIIEPVQLFTFWNNTAHFIWKSIPGKVGCFFNDKDVHANNVLRIFWYHFIPDNLIELKIWCTKIGYDIRWVNMIINSVFTQCLEDSRNRLTEIGELASLTDEWKEWRKLLADEWAQKWARIYLFDFGSWILPENS